MDDLCTIVARTSLSDQQASIGLQDQFDLANGLQVQRITLFTIAWGPRNPQKCRDVQALAQLLLPSSATKVAGYRTPQFPVRLAGNARPIILHYGEMTLVHMLLAAYRANPNIITPQLELPFEVVTQRGNLNKVALMEEKWRMGVQKIGNTLFLRRYLDRKHANFAEIGYQFERACTNYVHANVRNAEYHSHLLASAIKIGSFRILLESEIDAVDEATQNLPLDQQRIIELKCTKNLQKLQNFSGRHWLQSYLADVNYLKVGVCSEDNYGSKIINSVYNLPLNRIATEDKKQTLMNRILQALQYLYQNAQEGKVYQYYYTKQGNKLQEVSESEKFVDKKMLQQIIDFTLAHKAEQ
eukprot:TRINITY_DN1097_c0_g1_i2.p1 TRINITY_DN1097_c0_g1~~TRINITY_DN1097_c0_g1_i2.p1  ORF type:complete len:355 (+),score=20.03 TRINITY_DN1097_c0_g1_i2:186-1250(+)